jgi:hypothetical protein
MGGRMPLIAVAFAVGIATASLIPGLSLSVRQLVGLRPVGAPSLANAPQGPDTEAGKAEAKQIVIKLTDEQIANAQIEVAAAQSGALSQRILVPGAVTPDANRRR